MNFFLQLFEKNQKSEPKEHVLEQHFESRHDIANGGEFLDDAIRTIDQPFMYMHTEKSVASGSPEGFW